ncbi:hypothetical protein D3C72_747040 [compost metagenome]
MYLIADTLHTHAVIVVNTIGRSGSRNGFGCSVYIIVTDLTTLIVVSSDTIVVEVGHFIVYNIDAVIRSSRAGSGKRNTVVTTTGSVCRTGNNFIFSEIDILYT